MKQDKLKNKDFRYFIIPFLALFILFSGLTYINTSISIKKSYETIEENTLENVDSYTRRFANSQAATDIITKLLDEKLLVASEAILLMEDNKDNKKLAELAQRFKVDEIFLYDETGEIIYSTVDEYMGWKANEGHPVYNFMTSGMKTLVEDLRADTESGVYYKYAYVRGEDNTFVQIGVLADNVHKFLESFEIDRLIDDIMDKSGVLAVFFTDANFKLVASSLD